MPANESACEQSLPVAHEPVCVLPDGLTRKGKNPGAALASTAVPGKLRFNINDFGLVYSRELTLTGSVYSEAGQFGELKYFPKDVSAVLNLGNADYTLLFTGPGEGKLFQNSTRQFAIGVFMIGTFNVVQ